MLGPGPCLEYLSQTDDPSVSPIAPQHLPYILNLETILHIHASLMRTSESINAAPMVLGWADILQALAVRVAKKAAQTATRDPKELNRSQSTDDGDHFGPDVYQDVVEKMLVGPHDADIDVIQYLASSAVDCGQVFQSLRDLSLQLGGMSNSYFSAIVGARMRLVILDLIRSSSTIGYIPEVVEASLAALTGGQSYWDILDSKQLHEDNDPLAKFLDDADLVELLIASAKHRYPYESALLRMTRALATCYGERGSSIVPHISTIDTFAGVLPVSFSGYMTTQEEENNNSIRLMTSLPLFEEHHAARDSSLAMIRIDLDFVIPSETYGRMLVEANPKVAYWFHQYLGIKYFGKVKVLNLSKRKTMANLAILQVLETFLVASDVIDVTTGGKADRDSVADIIGTFAGLLLGISKATEAALGSGSDPSAIKDEAYQLIEVASSGLGNNRDIVTVIFDIFEEELQLQSTNFGSDVSLEVLVRSVNTLLLDRRFRIMSKGRLKTFYVK